jgi:hypothetical protein
MAQDHVLDEMFAACRMKDLLGDGSTKWDFSLDKLSQRVNSFIYFSSFLREATKCRRI